MREFAEACAHRPDLLRIFLEIQVRAALEGVDMQGPARIAVQKVAEMLDISRLELAHMEAVLRIRREQFRAGARPGGAGGRQAPPQGMQLAAAYEILEVDAKAPDEEVAKAYRRQLSKHHPDKLKANGLPDSMMEHAKQRTQQIIEAYELIKSSRAEVNCRACRLPGSRHRFCPQTSRGSATKSKSVLAAGADIVHFDVMDNHYVPNLTVGPMVCAALRKHGIKAPLDVHLMVKPVDRIIPDFAKAGATYISFHPEATRARGSHHRADPRAWLQAGTGVQSRDAAGPSGFHAQEARHGAADVGESRALAASNSFPVCSTRCAPCASSSTPPEGPSAWRSTAG